MNNIRIFKRSSLGTSKIKIIHRSFEGPYGRCVSNIAQIVNYDNGRQLLWTAQNHDLRKLKRRMRRAGWIK